MKQTQRGWQFVVPTPDKIDIQNIKETLTRESPVALCMSRKVEGNDFVEGIAVLHRSVYVKFTASGNLKNISSYIGKLQSFFEGRITAEVDELGYAVIYLKSTADSHCAVKAVKNIMGAAIPNKLPCICTVAYPKVF